MKGFPNAAHEVLTRQLLRALGLAGLLTGLALGFAVLDSLDDVFESLLESEDDVLLESELDALLESDVEDSLESLFFLSGFDELYRSAYQPLPLRTNPVPPLTCRLAV